MKTPLYTELQEKLSKIEQKTGLYLADPCVDAENVGRDASDWKLYDSALCAAEGRAYEAGFNLHDLLKTV